MQIVDIAVMVSKASKNKTEKSKTFSAMLNRKGPPR